MKLDIVRIAEICHAADHAYCQAVGLQSQEWNSSPPGQRDAEIRRVDSILTNPHGEVLLDELAPVEQRRKDILFRAICLAVTAE